MEKKKPIDPMTILLIIGMALFFIGGGITILGGYLELMPVIGVGVTTAFIGLIITVVHGTVESIDAGDGDY